MNITVKLVISKKKLPNFISVVHLKTRNQSLSLLIRLKLRILKHNCVLLFEMKISLSAPQTLLFSGSELVFNGHVSRVMSSRHTLRCERHIRLAEWARNSQLSLPKKLLLQNISSSATASSILKNIWWSPYSRWIRAVNAVFVSPHESS
jgi:hypothetical protein